MRISLRPVLAVLLIGCALEAPPVQAQSFVRDIGNGQGHGNGYFFNASSVAVDTVNGSNVVVADTGNNRVEVFSAAGVFLRTFGSLGSGNGQLNGPAGVAIDTAHGGNILVADPGNHRVDVFSPTGSFIRAIGNGPGTGNGQLGGPIAVAVDTANGGNVVVDDVGNSRIAVFSATGAFIRNIGNGFGSSPGQLNAPNGVAVDTAHGGNVLVADSFNNRVEVFSATGTFIRTIGNGVGLSPGQLSAPLSVAVDLVNGGNAVISDTGNDRIDVFSPTGDFIRIIGGTNLMTGANPTPSPRGVAVDSANGGNVIVYSNPFNQVEVFTAGPGPAPLAAAILPGARSVPIGTPATVFATLVNGGTTALNNCSISLEGGTQDAAPQGLTLDFQTTNPATNTLIGVLDQPVSIGANGSQSFLLSFGFAGSSLDLTVAELAPIFVCGGVPPAGLLQGVDTVDLNFSQTPEPDIIAIAAASGGVLTIPQSTGGSGAFAVAAVDAGAAGTVVALLGTGSANLPLTVTICATDPATAACLAPPSNAVQTVFQHGGTQTYSIFASASAPIAFAPGTARVFVNFSDGSAALRGTTSVAVKTQ